MGYFTSWTGCLSIYPTLPPSITAYLNHFLEHRHVLTKGPNAGAYDIEDPHPGVVVDYNSPPPGQPFVWCDWRLQDGRSLFISRRRNYRSIEWLQYLIHHFIAPCGCVVNGRMNWSGEEDGDSGSLFVENNVVRVVPAFAVRPSGNALPRWCNPFQERYLEMERKVSFAFDPKCIIHDRTGLYEWPKQGLPPHLMPPDRAVVQRGWMCVT